MRGLARNIKCTSRLILATRLTTKIPCFKPVLCLSLFRKALPRRPVASVDAHTTMVTAQCGEQPPAAVARRTTGQQCVEALGGGTVCQDIHPPQEGHINRGRRPLCSKQFKKGKAAGGGPAGYKKSIPKKPGSGKPKTHKAFSLTITRQHSGPSYPPIVTGLGSEGTSNVSKPAGLSAPAHLPKTTGGGRGLHASPAQFQTLPPYSLVGSWHAPHLDIL